MKAGQDVTVGRKRDRSDARPAKVVDVKYRERPCLTGTGRRFRGMFPKVRFTDGSTLVVRAADCAPA